MTERGLTAAVSLLGVDAARLLTERIRYTALSVRDNMEKLQRLVDEARTGEAHVALGYASWTAYLAATLGDQPLRLPRDQRQELVGYLAGEGMSTRAIAPIVGVDKDTVRRDLSSGGANTPPETLTLKESAQRNESVERGIAHVQAQRANERAVTGMDGKQYHSPTPSTPQRKPLTDQFFRATHELQLAVERLQRLADDDRFTRNVEQVATAHRNDLLEARDGLQSVLDRLPSLSEKDNQ